MSKPNTELVERIDEIMDSLLGNTPFEPFPNPRIEQEAKDNISFKKKWNRLRSKAKQAINQLIIDEKIALLQDICRDNWQKSIPEMYMLDRIKSLKELRDR